MRFHVKQRVFSLGDKYDITGDAGRPAFQVRGKLFSIGNKLDMLDSAGNVVARIEQRVLSFVSEYDIYRDGRQIAVVKKKLFSLFVPRFSIEGPDGSYEMQGDWLNWNYTISQNGQTVAQINRKLALVQDRYAVEIQDGADAPLLLALAIVMDEVMHPDEKE